MAERELIRPWDDLETTRKQGGKQGTIATEESVWRKGKGNDEDWSKRLCLAPWVLHTSHINHMTLFWRS